MRPDNAKTVSSTLVQTFNFARWLAISETITSASVVATVYSGNDTDPSAIFSGAAAVSGAEVTRTVTGGVLGNVYLLTATAVTSEGQTLPQEAYLVIVPPENA
jgi:hypothetical protein